MIIYLLMFALPPQLIINTEYIIISTFYRDHEVCQELAAGSRDSGPRMGSLLAQLQNVKGKLN